MLFYFIPPFLSLLGAFYYKRLTLQSRNIAYVITTAFAIFIYCCVYTNGSDWVVYEVYYNSLTWDNAFDTTWEWGFCFVMYLFKKLDADFFVFLIIAKSFSLITLSNFFKRNSSEIVKDGNFFWILFIFYCGFCMYLYVETIIRFAIALAIVVRSYKYLINRKVFFYFFAILLAVFFHKSAIIMIPFYFCRSIALSNRMLMLLFILILFFCSPVVLINIFELLANYVSPLFLLPLAGYTAKVANVDFTIFSMGNIVYMLFLLCCILNRRGVEIRRNGRVLFGLCMIYFIVSFIAFSAGSVERISLYFMPIFILTFVTVLSYSVRWMSLFMHFFVIAYFTLSMGGKIIESKVFLPYSNYLISVLSRNTHPFIERERFLNSRFEDMPVE